MRHLLQCEWLLGGHEQSPGRSQYAIMRYLLQCEWLLGGREQSPAETQVTGCISEDSELFKALVEDPQVQVGLNSTKCLIGKKKC